MTAIARLFGLSSLVLALVAATASPVSGQTFANGLVAYYPFNGNANDAIGTNNGTVFGATLATDRFGNANRAYYFNGSSYIQIPTSTNVFGSQDFTVSMWFNSAGFFNISNSSTQARFLISKGTSNFELHLGSLLGTPSATPSGFRFLPRNHLNSGPSWDTPALSYQTNVWQHIVAVYQPSTTNVMMFCNGVSLSIIGSSTTPAGTNNITPARLGMRFDGTLAFQGMLDSVRIYNRGLSANEVQQLYQYEAGIPLPTVVASKALRLDFGNLAAGGYYQIQTSGDLTAWTNYGLPFFAASTNGVQYVDVGWSNGFFRLQQP